MPSSRILHRYLSAKTQALYGRISSSANASKANHYNGNYAKSFFWRTTQQQEIDYIEEADGNFTAFEMNGILINVQSPFHLLS